MKKIRLSFTLFLFILGISYAQTYQPYTIGAETDESISELSAKVKTKLQENGFEILGEYKPANDPNRLLIAISSSQLKHAIGQVGGLTGFAAALRVGITREGGKTIISYTTPEYWGSAYFQKSYIKVQSNYRGISSKLSAALASFGTTEQKGFGSKKGMSISKLQSFHYMIGMPYFTDNIELGEFTSYQQAVSTIDANLSKGIKNLKKVYAVSLAEHKIKLYGIGLSGEKGESSFLPTIDISSPKHTAFLPYEMLVLDKKVFMLHGRFRIALSFPDLSMGTFMKIVSTPGDIKDLLKTALEQ